MTSTINNNFKNSLVFPERSSNIELKPTPMSSSSSSASSTTSLSLLSSARSKDSSSAVAPPHIRYQTSPLSNMSSIEYQQQHQQESNNNITNTNTAGDSSSQMDYLEYLQKQPCHPPTYSAANASRNIRYPIYEQVETHQLPDYSPSINQVALVLRKVEWLSPYEPSPIRSWKNLVMELNSTQLNFYSIDNLPLLHRVKKSKTKKYYEFTPIENDFILNAVKKKPGDYLTTKRLVKSYSLQFAKFGLPVDYKKKNNCLRIRAETEQFIIHFHSIDEMISWSNYLSVGINVSLDIDTRPMPSDRTVPRRRRNRRCSSSNRNRSYSDSELIRRELTPTKRRSSFSGESSIRNKISRIFNRKKSNPSSFDIEELSKSFQQSSLTSSTTPSSSSSIPNSQHERSASLPNNTSLESSSEPVSRSPTDEAESIRNEMTTIREEEEEGEANSVHELHDEEDDESDEDEDDLSIHHSNQSAADMFFNDYQFNFHEKIWKPEHKIMTRRKFLKDSLRCIKLLPGDEEWVGKCLVRSSNPPKFETSNQIKSKSSKNKFVKEYIVGPQGLVSVCV